MAFLSAVGGVFGTLLGTLGTAASVAGTIASAYGAYQAGKQQQEAARMNAKMALSQAKLEQAKHQLEETRHRERARRLLSRSKSLYLKAGVTMEGTPLDVITETATEAERDAILIAAGGTGAYAEKLFEAGMFRQMGRAARQAGTLRAGTTLLTGLGGGLAGYGGMQPTQQKE